MTIQLTTPFDPGDFDPGHVYDRADLTELHFYANSREVIAVFEYGEGSGGAFEAGAKAPRIELRYSGADFTTIVTADPSTLTDSLVSQLKKGLSQLAIVRGSIDGTLD